MRLLGRRARGARTVAPDGTDFAFGAPTRQPDGAVEVTFRVPADHPCLKGHFPGDPMVPGVAQVVAVAEARARAAWPDLGPAVGLRRLKFKRALRPADELVLRLLRSGERVAFRIRRGDEEATRGTLLFATPPG